MPIKDYRRSRRNNKPWTTKDDEHLARLVADNVRNKDIAIEMRRPSGTISYKRRALEKEAKGQFQ